MKIKKIDKSGIELSDDFKITLRLMKNTRENIFITGRAGTGKSTLLQYFRENTKKSVAVVAPTGVAAVNVHGQTLHSFCKFKPGITLSKVRKLPDEQQCLYYKLNMIIIDEISMVRADLLDCVDKFLRLNGRRKKLPFGGIQMVFVGDPYQLAPVVPPNEAEIFQTYYKSPYFFDAKVFENFHFKFIELKKIYRQTDRDFIEILDNIRTGKTTEEQLAVINKKVNPYFKSSLNDGFVHLMATNAMAESMNNFKLFQIQEEPIVFEGVLSGNFLGNQLPTNKTLILKRNAQIMMLNNDERGWVNGDIGKISEIGKAGIKVELSKGKIITVTPYTWKKTRLYYNGDKMCIESEEIGLFTQYPVRLAWAVTIHKGQSKTFKKAVVDFGEGTFAFGQAYVALSRCTSLEGLVLKAPVEHRHIFVDDRIKEFMKKFLI